MLKVIYVVKAFSLQSRLLVCNSVLNVDKESVTNNLFGVPVYLHPLDVYGEPKEVSWEKECQTLEELCVKRVNMFRTPKTLPVTDNVKHIHYHAFCCYYTCPLHVSRTKNYCVPNNKGALVGVSQFCQLWWKAALLKKAIGTGATIDRDLIFVTKQQGEGGFSIVQIF